MEVLLIPTEYLKTAAAMLDDWDGEDSEIMIYRIIDLLAERELRPQGTMH